MSSNNASRRNPNAMNVNVQRERVVAARNNVSTPTNSSMGYVHNWSVSGLQRRNAVPLSPESTAAIIRNASTQPTQHAGRRHKTRRGRSARRSRSGRRVRSGGANDMNYSGIEMSNTERANAANAAAAAAANAPPMNANVPANPLEGVNAPPALQLHHAVPVVLQHQVGNQHHLVGVQPRAANQNVQMVPAGPVGLVFNPPPQVPHNPQGPIGGRPHKSRRHKTRRHKSHRRKSHRR